MPNLIIVDCPCRKQSEKIYFTKFTQLYKGNDTLTIRQRYIIIIIILIIILFIIRFYKKGSV